ncbi:MAG TPA: hypothetical protein VKS79_11800 [Gemmataceae bacterium]|nr:hypothetical protein [Gemmataceae bacterium]
MAESLNQALVWIDQALAISPIATRVAAFQKRLEKLDSQNPTGQILADCRAIVEQSNENWHSELAVLAPNLTPEQSELLILLRGLLEGVQKKHAPASVWIELRILARDLLGDRFQIEFVRDSQQPAEWFDPPVETDGPAAGCERVGLAVRAAEQAWFCFPKGRLFVGAPPKRSAREEAAESIRQLISSTPAIRSLEAPANAIIKASQNLEQQASVELAASFLDALAGIQPTAENESALEAMLEQTRRWCAEFGWAILPRDWRFQSASRPQDAQPRSQHVQLEFHPAPPGSVIRVTRFGLAQGDEVLCECELAVSAGPEPAGYADLADLLTHRTPIGGNAFRERLQAWPEAAMAGTLEMTAVQMFVDFWGALGESLRNRNREAAQEFSSRLTDVLRQNWRLYPFYPAAYQDHPDGWLQRAPGRNMVTGRVRRVLRPGLQDEEGHLRVPALVEVE